MKKIYIAPFCKIREVKKCDIIATSENIGLGDAKNSGSHNSAGRGSWWDDDDDDEY